ncbi:MAG: glycosyltransferase, partial [Actinobacteria bacterium]|nr:glycosyltransferase [Actinomycetota bacterium]
VRSSVSIFGPGGTRLKILAAMSTGLPIISTKTGVAGLMVKDNEDVLIAKNPDDFVRKTKTVLTDKVLFEKLRTNSYLLVKKYYSYEKISHQLEIIYQKIKRHEIRD